MIIGQDYANALTDVPTQMLIAPVLPTMVSDRAYAVGEQFIVNSVLYEITQTVSAADVPLVVGTNCKLSDSITQQIKSASVVFTPLSENVNVNASTIVIKREGRIVVAKLAIRPQQQYSANVSYTIGDIANNSDYPDSAIYFPIMLSNVVCGVGSISGNGRITASISQNVSTTSTVTMCFVYYRK